MEQYSVKKVLFILTGSTFLLLGLVFNIPSTIRKPRVSASMCMGELQLGQIEAEFRILQTRARTMLEYIPPTMPDIIPTAGTNYPMTMPTPTILTPTTYTPAMPTSPLIPTPQTYPTYMPGTPIYPTTTNNYYGTNPTQP